MTQSRLTEGFDHAVERHKRPDLFATAVQRNTPAGQRFKGHPVHQRVESARAVVAKNVRRPQERKRNAGRRSEPFEVLLAPSLREGIPVLGIGRIRRVNPFSEPVYRAGTEVDQPLNSRIFLQRTRDRKGPVRIDLVVLRVLRIGEGFIYKSGQMYHDIHTSARLRQPTGIEDVAAHEAHLFEDFVFAGSEKEAPVVADQLIVHNDAFHLGQRIQGLAQ